MQNILSFLAFYDWDKYGKILVAFKMLWRQPNPIFRDITRCIPPNMQRVACFPISCTPLFMAWDKFWYTNVLPFLSSCVSIMPWHLYSGDTLGTKASVPWMVGLRFVNNKPKNKMFIFYSASESTVDIISSREIHVMDKKITINLPLWCCVLNLSSAVEHQF